MSDGLTMTRKDIAALGRTVVNGEAVKLGPNSPLRKPTPAATTSEPTGPKYKSKGEAAYGGRLFALQRVGDILEWRYESVTLRLADRVRYTADFYVRCRDGSIELHEVKGTTHTWEDARVKLQVAKAMYPEFRFLLVRMRRAAVESITPIRPLSEVAA